MRGSRTRDAHDVSIEDHPSAFDSSQDQPGAERGADRDVAVLPSRATSPSAPAPTPETPVRLTANQETFVQILLAFGDATKAYRMSYAVGDGVGARSVHRQAWQLLSNRRVRARIDQLRRLRPIATIDTLLEEFDQNRNGAIQAGNFAAANGATRGKADLLGFTSQDAAEGAGAKTQINILIVDKDRSLF